MIDYLKLLECFLYSFFLTLVISPLVISLIKREKIKQTILHYVESHKSKNGTPTMGGIIFILSIFILSFICLLENSLNAKMILILFFVFGLVGFLDDFIKFKFKRNLGLRPYQKIIFQVAVSFFAGWFVYKNIGSIVLIPFSNIPVDFGLWIIPFVMIIYLATTNAVNLTDGLDGLATSTTLVSILTFLVLEIVLFNNGYLLTNEAEIFEINNLLIISSVSIGALFCFLLFNCFPAKIFMGDTGSLALGSLIASLYVFSGLELYLPIVCVVFVANAVSVILQVAYYKLTKKRIFLMAPLHHHFEKKGVHEVRITMGYATVCLIVGFVVVLINIL